MPDTRPVWITREQRDFCRLWQSEQVNAIADAWDAAPADPGGAAMAALLSERLIPVRSFKDRAVHLVLAALGQPEGDA